MADWQNFYLQKMGTDGSGNAYTVHESVSTWGIWCREIPFKPFEKVKEPASFSWLGEHGVDEYIPDTGLLMDAYTMNLELGCKVLSVSEAATYGTQVDDVRIAVKTFLDFLRTTGMMNIYSPYTRIGRRNVRLSGVNDNAMMEKDINGHYFLTFTVELKVCDPVTDITLSL